MVFEQAELAFGLYTTSTDFFLLCKKANLDNVQYSGHSPLIIIGIIVPTMSE